MLFSFLIHLVIRITLATQEGIAVAQVASFFAYFFISPESLVPRFHYPYHLIPSLGSNIVNRFCACFGWYRDDASFLEGVELVVCVRGGHVACATEMRDRVEESLTAAATEGHLDAFESVRVEPGF